MNLAYRILGITAGLTERASRTRGNGVPMNWMVLVLLGIFLALPIHEALEVKINEGDPIKTTIADATSSQKLLDRYITVTGQLHPDQAVTETENDKVKNKNITWLPLIDVAGHSGIYVKTDITEPNRGVISRVEGSEKNFAGRPKVAVSGMLRKIDKNLQAAVRTTSEPIDGVKLNSEYILVAGTKPAGFYLWIALAAAILIPILLMLLVIFKRYVIFRPDRSIATGINPAAPPPTSQEPINLRTTARFFFEGNVRKRFHRVPSVIAQTENGDMAILANVDASSRFMGQVTKNRSGIWAAVIRDETLIAPEYGTLYFGLEALPAFRIHYADAIKNATATAILASATPEGLQRIRQALYEPHLTPPPPPAEATPAAARQPG